MLVPPRTLPWVHRRRSSPVAAIWFALASIATASAGEVEVSIYTIRSIPLNAPSAAKVVYLDEVSAIEEELSLSLPHDPARAVTSAHQRLADEGATLPRDLATAYEGITEAWSLGISTLPAVVVDRRYIIYGETDIALALGRIEAFRSAQP